MLEAELKKQVAHWLGDFPPEVPLVVVPVYNAYDDVLECLDSLLSHTPATPLLLLDDASPDTRIAASLEPLAKTQSFYYLRLAENVGLVKSLNLAFDCAAARDVVVV